jgi:hypothetical protein
MMTPAKKDKVVELGFTPFSPVFDVMGVAVLQVTAWKLTAAIPVGQCAAQGPRHRASLAPNIERSTFGIVPHDDLGRITGQPPGRFRGNVLSLLQHREPELIGILEDRLIDMDHDLETIPSWAGPHAVSERAFGDKTDRVGPPLTSGRLFISAVARALLEQDLFRRLERLQHRSRRGQSLPCADQAHSKSGRIRYPDMNQSQ